MCHMETKELDSTLGQSTKGFVYKVMDHFSRKVVGTFRENNNHQYTTNRGRGRGRGGRGGSHYRKRQPENTLLFRGNAKIRQKNATGFHTSPGHR